MTSPVTTTSSAARESGTERAVAIATCAAPWATGVLAPLLDSGAAFTATLAYGVGAGFLAVNYMHRLPDALLHNLPAGDIIRAHRSTLFASTLTSSAALAVGTLLGTEGADALLFGFMNLLERPIPGIVSLGWWAATLVVPWKLRKIFSRKKQSAAGASNPIPAMPQLPPDVAKIRDLWGAYIAHPRTGIHKGEHLEIHTYSPRRWTGTITALAGRAVTVTKKSVSSVYRVNPEWVQFKDGSHTGERHITVNLVAPPELDPTTLVGAWKKYAARSGGVMAGTHLTNAQHDPNTGGEVAYVDADENIDALPTPTMRDLVGALRTSHLLLSYEPSPNPRRAIIRLMKENPLKAGVPLTNTDALLPSENGYFRIGTAVSGRPMRAQLLDPKIGARHLLVSGVTGSGKGGVLQLIALSAYLSGAVIIYADPKGSSNPAIEQMAAYSGLGEDGAMGALLLMEAIHQHRVDLTGKLGLKNFDRSRMPHIVFIMDEASALLGAKAKHRDRATAIVARLSKEGRSLGESVVLATQIVQLTELGGNSAIRDNIVGNGGCIMLRSDSSQRHLVSLPPGMESVNPADIPATWSGEEDDVLVYTDDVVLHDPESTFGLGYYMTTDGVCAMSRSLTLEDATPHVDPARAEIPYDWPDWERREEIVAAALAADGATGGTSFTPLPAGTPAVDMAKKPASTEDKIMAALKNMADPLGIDVNYLHKDQIGSLAGAEGSTLANALTRLTKAGDIHRQVKDGKEVPGMYGLGPAPQPTSGDEPPADQPQPQTDQAMEEQLNELLPEAIELVISTQFGSAAMLQRKLRIGWQLANALLNAMELIGAVGPANGDKAREVRVKPEDLDAILRDSQRPEDAGE